MNLKAAVLENGRRTLLGSALACLLLTLPGCQTMISPTTDYAQVRFIDASPDVGGIDYYEGSQAVLYNTGFGTVSSPVATNPGTYRFSVNATGGRTALVTATATISAGKQYAVMVSNVAASLQETVFTSQSQPAPSGQIAFRFIDEATAVGPVDVYAVPSGATLATVNPILTGLSFNTIGNYIDIPTGSYTIIILAAGTTTSTTTTPITALYTGPLTAYTGGSVHSLLIIDQQILTAPAANVVTFTDYESPAAVSAN